MEALHPDSGPKVSYSGVRSMLSNDRHSSDYHTYAECTLQALFLESGLSGGGGYGRRGQPTAGVQELLDVAEACTDVCASYSWVDFCFRTEESNVAKLDMRKSQDTSQEVWVRCYLSPPSLRHICAVRQLSSSHVVKNQNRSLSNVRRVTEAHCDKGVLDFLRQGAFRQVHETYVRARIYHLRFSTSSHVMLLIQQHFEDPEFQAPAFPGQWLVEAKTRCTDDTTVDFAENNLSTFASLLRPLVHLRKVDDEKVHQKRDVHRF